jgi:competence protein ComEA
MQRPSKSQLVVLAIIVALVFGGGMQYGRYRTGREQAANDFLAAIEEEAAPLNAQPAAVVEEAPAAPPPLAVHVKGAVQAPGLYELPPGSRVSDALVLAGLLPEANTDIINLAWPLSDSAEVVVPFRQQGEETDWEALAVSAATANKASAGGGGGSGGGGSGGTGGGGAASNLVNINSANLTALQALSGIGPAKAQAIIDYREQHGPFAKIEDITKVSGIGPSTYDKIKDHICVE